MQVFGVVLSASLLRAHLNTNLRSSRSPPRQQRADTNNITKKPISGFKERIH